jgi:hypothetical protein
MSGSAPRACSRVFANPSSSCTAKKAARIIGSLARPHVAQQEPSAGGDDTPRLGERRTLRPGCEMVKHQRAHHTIDVRVRKRDAIGQRLMELELDTLSPRLRGCSPQHLGIAVDADQRHRPGSASDRQRHLAGTATEVEDPRRGATADRSLDESWAPLSLPHRNRVDGVVEGREHRTTGRWDISIAHPPTIVRSPDAPAKRGSPIYSALCHSYRTAPHSATSATPCRPTPASCSTSNHEVCATAAPRSSRVPRGVRTLTAASTPSAPQPKSKPRLLDSTG